MPRSLADRLRTLNENLSAQIPAEAGAIMHAATAALVASGQAERAVGVGDRMPAFALPDADGQVVDSGALLARGPLVLTFFRGHW